MRNVTWVVLVIVLSWVAGANVSSGAAAIETLLPRSISGGWVLIDGPRTFTPKTLFEHINGQAELFLKYGFQKSVFAVYQKAKNRQNQIDLDLYDMGNVLHAFGIFSRFRSEDRPGGIGLDSYFHEHSALFYKGRYFVVLYASEPDSAALKELSMAVSLRIPDHSPPPKEIGYFPKEGLKSGSIQYSPEGLLGHQFLKRGFQATYTEKDEDSSEIKLKPLDEGTDRVRTQEKEFHLFLAIFRNSHEALSALEAYRNYLLQKGKGAGNPPSELGIHSLGGEDPFQGQVLVVQRGNHLLGAVGFEKMKNGEGRLMELMKAVE